MQPNSTILFVDDEERSVKNFKKALQATFDIEVANSVPSAKVILQRKHSQIAVVMTDQRMPKQLGVELLQHTQTHYPSIVRMLTTAFSDIDSALDSINKAEVFRYITKPWNLDELEETLHLAINRYHSLQQSHGTTLSSTLMTELKEDCEHWLMYALHAYGDESVYRSGIEALACRYHILINNRFDGEQASTLTTQMDSIIHKDFLNDSIMKQLHTEENRGFGVVYPNKKSH